MLKRNIKNETYEIVASFYDDGQANAIARTIVEEGETPVNTYRLCVGARNPLTQVPFDKNQTELESYLLTNDQTIWDVYWEDPEPEEESE
jgi:hypothetical protein